MTKGAVRLKDETSDEEGSASSPAEMHHHHLGNSHNHDEEETPTHSEPSIFAPSPQNASEQKKPRIATSTRAHKSFGFAKNKFQVLLHLTLAALVGVSMRLCIFPQASIAADLEMDSFDYSVETELFDPNNITRAPFLIGNTTLGAAEIANAGKIRRHVVHTSFLLSFGLANAFANLIVGRSADAFGRKMPHVLGWVSGLFVSVVLMISHSWFSVVAANVFLGIQQAMVWSTNIFMLTDILGPKKRSVSAAVGNFMGFIAASLGAFVAAWLMHESGVDATFAAVFATCSAGLLLSAFFLQDTLPFVAVEAASELAGFNIKQKEEENQQTPEECMVQIGSHQDSPKTGKYTIAPTRPQIVVGTWSEIAWRTMFTNRSCFVVCLCGAGSSMVTGLVWGLVLIWGHSQGLSHFQAAAVNNLYYIPNAVMVLVAGLLSDRMTVRKPVLMTGLAFLVVGLVIASTAGEPNISRKMIWIRLIVGATLLGTGSGVSYPVLSAAIGDHTPAAVWRLLLFCY